MRRSTTLLAAIALIVGGADVAAAQEGGSCTPAPRTPEKLMCPGSHPQLVAPQ